MLRCVLAVFALNAASVQASRPFNCPHDELQATLAAEPFTWALEPALPTTAADVRIDCSDTGCQVARSLVVSNPMATAYDGLLLAPRQVLVDGALVNEQRIDVLAADARYRARITEMCSGVEVAVCLREGKIKSAHAVPVHVEPGASVRITTSFAEPLIFDFPRRANEIPLGCAGSVDPVPIQTRHPLLGRWHDRVPRVGTAVLTVRGAAEVAITYPRGWALHVPGGSAPTAAPGDSLQLRASMQDSIAITRTLPAASLLRRGGPFIAVGGSGAADALRVAARAGYELATPGWLIYSAALESDFDRVAVVPSIEAALSTTWNLHWAGGLGMPVEIVGDPAVGLRGQLALHTAVVGIVLTLDYFPSRDATVYGAYGQLSL